MTTPTQPITALWTAATPISWPDAPADLTFSTLREIEACPRRWALASANYPSLWNERGYPPRANIKALAGTVVHTVLETVTKELINAGCSSVFDASAVAVLKRLGGLSNVVGRAIDQLAARTANNPRMTRLADHFTRSLRAQVSELRVRAQTMLARRVLLSRPASATTAVGRRGRGPLGHGVYCEMELRVPRLGWKGRADLLALAPDSCQITDFKTGEPSEDHAWQLRVYAVLWNRDDALNPAGRRVTALTLAYAHGDVAVPAPTAEGITALESELSVRGAVARNSVAAHPPEARPNCENCRFCAVRHLCDVYWRPEVQERLADAGMREHRAFVDIEAIVERPHGPKSWDIAIGARTNRTRGLLRTSGDIQFEAGQTLRILDAAQAADNPEGGGVRCLTIGILSEVYIVPSTAT